MRVGMALYRNGGGAAAARPVAILLQFGVATTLSLSTQVTLDEKSSSQLQ